MSKFNYNLIMQLFIRRALLLIISIALTFVSYRLYLHWNPHSNLYIAGYNIHHLYVGLVLIVLGAIPAILIAGKSYWLDLAIITFGVGLASALDQIVYLITTDGSDAAYLLPISFIGGLIAIIATLLYIAVLWVASVPVASVPGPTKR